MRNAIAVLLTLIAMALPAVAKQPKTYDLTGTVSFSSYHSDSEAHVTVNGERYDAYCSTTGASVDCSDTGGVFEITLADGSEAGFLPLNEFPSQCCGDPVTDAMRGKRSASFSYRVPPHYLGQKYPTICVPFTDAKGKSKEACYAITVNTTTLQR